MQLDCRAPDHEIKAHASWSAARVRTILVRFGQALHAPVDAAQLRERLDFAAWASQAQPVAKKTTLAGTIARMVDPGWWARNLRRSTLRANENLEHAAGLVRRKHQVYVTDHASKIKRARDKANRQTLEGLEVANDAGEAFNLQEVADASVSNPKLRRAELMTRCRGFEEAAEFMGHKGLFLTLTCPSRFHRITHAGIENKKWIGATVKDGQQYLCKVWAKVRAAWKKAGVIVYGFRVAEPHHDGCPHWHLLLFCAPDFVRDALAIAARYALADSPNEAGAKKHRFTVKRIDPAQGSATGYIAKYIAKNIDGEKETGDTIGLDFDSGTPAEQAARRVRDWAGVHGIRQFQQIGGPSVTVWRELRRLGAETEALQQELFEKPRAAASRGDWFSFWMVQGGPEVARRDLSLSPFYVADDLGKYGDETKKIKGVIGVEAGREFVEITRLTAWTVQRAGTSAADHQQAEFEERREFHRRNGALLAAYSDFEFKRIGAADQARTGVNNCSEAGRPVFDFSSFDPDPGDRIDHRPDPEKAGDLETVWADLIAAQIEEQKTNDRYEFTR